MSSLSLALIVLAVLVALYALLVLALLVAGRRDDARALASFIPDCLVLFRGLLGDERVPRSRKLVLILLVAYLVSPIDLIPDFIPVAGQLDDAIVTALVLRFVLRGGGPPLLDEHWSGPPQGLRLIKRLAFGAKAGARAAPADAVQDVALRPASRRGPATRAEGPRRPRSVRSPGHSG